MAILNIYEAMKSSSILSSCKNKIIALYITSQVISAKDGKECGLTSFEYIRITKVQLRYLARDAFHGKSNVINLALTYNNLTCIPDLTNIAASLTKFYINNNSLGKCEVDVKYQVNFCKMTDIDLAWNGLSELPSIVFQSVSLEELNLVKNNFVQVPNLLKVSSALFEINIMDNENLKCCSTPWIYNVKTVFTRIVECCARLAQGACRKRITYKGGFIYFGHIKCTAFCTAK